MSRLLKLALIQQHATPDKEENLRRGIRAFEEAARQGVRLIAFPELAFTYFYPQNLPEGDVHNLAETIPGPTTEIFSELAKKWSVVTVLNLFETDGKNTYDASPVLDANGLLLGTTRMVHVMEAPCFHEKHYYAPGEGKPLVYDTAVGKIGVAICYDRHFPEYMRALALQGAELVIVPQAGAVDEWPEGLFEAELRVAAFQNGYFTALCNRVGKEECVAFEGKSFLVNPQGKILEQAPAEQDHILISEIDLNEINDSFARKYFLPDRRPQVYKKWWD